jgi:cytochrome oxidase Cu insertion factor (SCO1/SenC/PrrC family)/thiol-disulfide isomerase/thioredoxin
MWVGLALVLLAVSAVSIVLDTSRRSSTSSPAFTPALDPGTPLSGAAPDFTLTDQSGARVALHDFRGKVVLLAFNDSQCTTICPLTTTAMVNAKRLLGPAGSQVALLGIDANPQAISISDVRSYSEMHGMTRSWQFLTGSLPQLRSVWSAYHIAVAIEHGQIDHTPALFVIRPDGQFAKLYLTQMSYSSIDQQGQLLAQEASSLLPGHPRVLSRLSYAEIPPIAPGTPVSLPRAGGGTVRLGPLNAPRLYVFFATWDSEVTDLAGALDALARYDKLAAADGLPRLVAVDEGSVEPSPAALTAFLTKVRLPYPVAIDQTGRVADGYGVQDEPWFVLISGSGKFLWYYDISTLGWLSTDQLAARVRAARARPALPSSAAAVQAALAGSPPPLNALHQQAGQLLGTQAALFERLKALRGYPVVLNAWASWCGPCRAEFGLLAAASAGYGRRVAFIGADTSDVAGDARAFLAQHPVSYPSYPVSNPAALSQLAAVAGLPTTIFIDRAGKVVYVHTGQYESQGTLDQDIATYAR